MNVSESLELEMDIDDYIEDMITKLDREYLTTSMTAEEYDRKCDVIRSIAQELLNIDN
jgi:hypothetical protein